MEFGKIIIIFRRVRIYLFLFALSASQAVLAVSISRLPNPGVEDFSSFNAMSSDGSTIYSNNFPSEDPGKLSYYRDGVLSEIALDSGDIVLTQAQLYDVSSDGTVFTGAATDGVQTYAFAVDITGATVLPFTPISAPSISLFSKPLISADGTTVAIAGLGDDSGETVAVFRGGVEIARIESEFSNQLLGINEDGSELYLKSQPKLVSGELAVVALDSVGVEVGAGDRFERLDSGDFIVRNELYSADATQRLQFFSSDFDLDDDLFVSLSGSPPIIFAGSDDRSIFAGTSLFIDPTGFPVAVATVWTEREDAQFYDFWELGQYLESLGVDIAAEGWLGFGGVLDISADGKKIIGFGGTLDQEGAVFLIDLSATQVPLPGAIWLFLSGALVLVYGRGRQQ